jgi:hypothetical protein
MKNALLATLLLLAPSLAMSQGVPPVVRYNAIAESIYMLERCGMLTAERRAWTANVRENAMLANGWDAAKAAAHDQILKAEFAKRYVEIPKERCDQLARGTDLERATTRKVP